MTPLTLQWQLKRDSDESMTKTWTFILNLELQADQKGMKMTISITPFLTIYFQKVKSGYDFKNLWKEERQGGQAR